MVGPAATLASAPRFVSEIISEIWVASGEILPILFRVPRETVFSLR